MSTNEKILAALKKAGKPLKSAEIATVAGIDKKEADKAIKELKKNGSVVSPRNCFYTIP